MRPQYPTCLKSARVRTIAVAALVGVLAWSACAMVHAQTNTATLSGTIVDASDKAVPGVKVTIVQPAKGFLRETVANDLGYFMAPLLPPGTYRVRFEFTGFAPAEISDLALDVNDRRVLKIALKIAKVNQSLTVYADSVALQESTSVGTTIGEHAVENLPLNGRNFQGLSALVPGAIPANGTRDANSGGVSVSGTRSFDNSFLLDGVDASPNAVEAITRINVAVTPNLDAIQEFKIQSSSYDAQFGHTPGGVINIISKSGTNEFHGTLYDYLRNAALNANTWQNDAARIPKGKRIRNQFGGVIGGPVTVPHVYSGHDRTFFFFDYEETHDILPPTLTTLVVPDAQMRTGDFSEFLGQFTLAAPYVNNVLPQQDLDPFASKIAALFPEPGHAGSLNDQQLLPNTFFDRRAGVRIDHRFSERDSMYGRYTYDDQYQQGSTWSALLSPASLQATAGYVAGITEVHVFSPNLMNEFRAGYTHSNPARTYAAPNRDLYAEFGLSGIPPATASPTGQFQFGGFPSIQNIGHGASVIDFGVVGAFTDSLTWSCGSHQAKFGAEVRPVRMSDYEPQAPRGQFQFADQNATDSSGQPLTVGFAEFLTGIPSKATFSTANTIAYRNTDLAFYAQDNWRITKSFALNAGLRYEYYTPVTEAHGRQANFDTTRGVLVYPKSFTGSLPASMAGIPIDRNGSSDLIKTDENDFAPRVGFALTLSPSTVLRGGYGIYYGFQEIGPWSFPSPGYNPPFNLIWVQSPQQFSSGYTLNPSSDPNAQFQIASMPPHLHTPRVMQWNVSVQRELTKHDDIELNYAGSHGNDLYTLTYFNQAYPGTTFDDLQSRLPFPYLSDTSQQTSNGGYSNYAGLLVKYNHRLSNGLNLLSSYTYSHALDNASDANLGSQHAGDTFRDPRHLDWEYGNSDFDTRHRFALSSVYQIPVGRGRRLGSSMSLPVDSILGGWQITGIFSMQTGYWYTPFGINDSCFCNDGNANSLRPDLVPGEQPNSGPKTPAEWFNTTAFTPDVPAGRHGDAGRNIVLGPPYTNLDLGLDKDFRFTERARLQFRSEFFDLANHPNFSAPVLQMANPDFGQIQTALASREIQLSLKLIY